ncbi:hypothetical protein BJX61DRAFT_79399 [Aspergillus egyptiacus]|nr:hypothetical protein BJX61DRAFT_79399 [Aspergillus egyptiacus]
MGIESYQVFNPSSNHSTMSAVHKTSESTYIFLDIKDNTLDDIDQHSHLDNQFDGKPHPPRYGLGTLERLPLEIIHLVLIQLDMQSLTDLRRVSNRARLVTDSIPQYRRVLIHAPALIRGSLNREEHASEMASKRLEAYNSRLPLRRAGGR